MASTLREELASLKIERPDPYFSAREDPVIRTVVEEAEVYGFSPGCCG